MFQQVARTNLADWGAIAQSAASRHDERINDLMANVVMLDGYDFQKPARGGKKIRLDLALSAVVVLFLLLLMRRGKKRQAIDQT